MSENTKKSTTTKATTKVASDDITSDVIVKKEAKETDISVEKKVPYKFAQDELILCRSVTGGELIFPSRKTGQMYVWSNYGDTCEVEFQDLQSLKSTRSDYILKPYFIIEDEKLVEQWSKDLLPVYEKFSGVEDIEAFFSLDLFEFERKLIDAPVGIKNTIKVFAAEKVQNKTLDSLNKIAILDEVLDTDLKSYIK